MPTRDQPRFDATFVVISNRISRRGTYAVWKRRYKLEGDCLYCPIWEQDFLTPIRKMFLHLAIRKTIRLKVVSILIAYNQMSPTDILSAHHCR